MRALKRALPGAASASDPVHSARLLAHPVSCALLELIKSESAKNNLDPYLVASLIRQESEFNPSVISYANAWGLMQLLPSGRQITGAPRGNDPLPDIPVLDPETNIRLGTRYLRQTLDRFGGVPEYALAAYNAGESRVRTGNLRAHRVGSTSS